MSNDQSILEQALDIERQLKELTLRQLDVLDPVLDRAADMDDEDLVWWIKHMPGGFHRSEMRGILRRRKGDDWMIEQGLMTPRAKV